MNYNYLIPSNIHAAAGLERIITMNERIWKSRTLHTKATKLLQDITNGINTYGIVPAPGTTDGTLVYAYEVDGTSTGITVDMDDANIPSLLSIPLLGWSGYNKEVYLNTRRRLLDPTLNPYYYAGKKLQGIGSPHTPNGYVWSMALSIEALTLTDPKLAIPIETQIESFVKQIRQSLLMSCNGKMHESVSSNVGCPQFTRDWFEWANALFVVLVETALGIRCDDLHNDKENDEVDDEDEDISNTVGDAGSKDIIDAEQYALNFNKKVINNNNNINQNSFYSDPYHNDPTISDFYQSISAIIPYN